MAAEAAKPAGQKTPAESSAMVTLLLALFLLPVAVIVMVCVPEARPDTVNRLAPGMRVALKSSTLCAVPPSTE